MRRGELDMDDLLWEYWTDDTSGFGEDEGGVPEEFKRKTYAYLSKAFEVYFRPDPTEELRRKLITLSLTLDLMKDWERTPNEELTKEDPSQPLSPREEMDIQKELEELIDQLGGGDLEQYLLDSEDQL